MSHLYLKILDYNKSKYYMVFFTTTLAVAIVFMFNITASILALNFSFEDSNFTMTMSGITGVLAIFFIFLINYGFSVLFDERKKEINVLISLGFSKMQIFGLICAESLLVFLSRFLWV